MLSVYILITQLVLDSQITWTGFLNLIAFPGILKPMSNEYILQHALDLAKSACSVFRC